MKRLFHGGDLESYPGVSLDLSVSLNPFGMPESVKTALYQAVEDKPRYPDPRCRKLRQALSDWEQVDSERILCGSGASDLLYRYAAVMRPKQALLTAPTFTEYEHALRHVGCHVDHFVLLPEQNFQPDKLLLERVTEELDLLMLCNPNNPTGSLLPPGFLTEILDHCRKKQVALLIDECFLELTEGVSVVGLLRDFPNVTVLKAFTKNFSLAGIRLGYCVSFDEKLLGKMEQAGPPWAVSQMAQAAGIAACGERQFLENSRERIRLLRRELESELKKKGLTVFPSDANFLLFQSGKALFEPLLQRGILIRKCGDFHGLSDDFYRVAVGTEEENRILITALEEIL